MKNIYFILLSIGVFAAVISCSKNTIVDKEDPKRIKSMQVLSNNIGGTGSEGLATGSPLKFIHIGLYPQTASCFLATPGGFNDYWHYLVPNINYMNKGTIQYTYDGEKRLASSVMQCSSDCEALNYSYPDNKIIANYEDGSLCYQATIPTTSFGSYNATFRPSITWPYEFQANFSNNGNTIHAILDQPGAAYAGSTIDVSLGASKEVTKIVAQSNNTFSAGVIPISRGTANITYSNTKSSISPEYFGLGFMGIGDAATLISSVTYQYEELKEDGSVANSYPPYTLNYAYDFDSKQRVTKMTITDTSGSDSYIVAFEYY